MTKPIYQFLTRSLLSKFRKTTDKDNLDKKLSKIDIVMGDDFCKKFVLLLVYSLREIKKDIIKNHM